MRLYLLISLFCISVNAQTGSGKSPMGLAENPVHDPAAITVRPEYPGGLEAFYAFFSENFKVTETLADINAKMQVYFTVEKDGSLTDIVVPKDPGFGLAKEAVRVMALSPRWSPAQLDGEPVRVRISLPVNISNTEKQTQE